MISGCFMLVRQEAIKQVGRMDDSFFMYAEDLDLCYRIKLVPIVVGVCPAPEVEAVLEALWGGDETLIVVSSDLSHFHSYEEARQIDEHTTERIEACESSLHGEDACGAYAINGLMLAAKLHGLQVRTLDVKNSGDTAGDRNRVVGYGAYALS